LSTDQNLDDEQFKRLKKQVKKEWAGYENAGKPLLLEAGLKWENFAVTPKDADYLNSDKMNDRRICRVYNVAPELVGDSENKTYSNYQEARKALYLETILVHGGYLRDELNNWLTPAWETERLYLDIDRDQIEEIREEMAKVYEWMNKAWWLKVNEKRVACGYEDVGPEGDVIMVPSNFVPLSDISWNTEEE
jgi:HK97 family phage portal protein